MATVLWIHVRHMKKLLRERRGQDLLEYAMLAGFVAVAGGAIFPTAVAPNISRIFSKVGSLMAWSPN